jgi:hypothetical protein
MTPLLTITSPEWSLNQPRWIPYEDQANATQPSRSYPPPENPTMITIGRGYHLQIYTCPASNDHAQFVTMQ